jgi:polysaccharide export outer membrane protein
MCAGVVCLIPLIAQDALVEESVAAVRTPPPSTAASVVTDVYRIGVADVLGVSVWGEPEHSIASVVVRPDGKISLPLLREIDVTGLTPLEVEDQLTEKFKEFINSPNVTVIVREVRSQLVYMTGGVNRPGSLLMRPGMTAWQALYEAGGVSEYGKKKKIYIVRELASGRTRIDFDYSAVMKGDLDADVVLQSGDMIVVPE